MKQSRKERRGGSCTLPGWRVIKQRILVVEDEPALGRMCRTVLTGAGFEVEIAVNGRIAQDMIEGNQYHLYLVDIKMPEMSGKELYEWLQKKHPRMARRVLLTTGSVLDGESMAFISQSGRPFLPKPYTPGGLIAAVEEALKQMEE